MRVNLMQYVFDPPPRTALPVTGSEAFFPVHRIYCVGRNYADHAREMGDDPGREPPFFFSKPADAAICAPEIRYPPATADLHHEVELVVALGTGGQDIPVNQALSHVFAYSVGVDLTRRDLQNAAKAQRRPWDTSKGFDQSAPCSKLVPARVCGHPAQNIISLDVNGVRRQVGRIDEMIWSVAEVISILSSLFTLQPGDLIFTGTPSGVGVVHSGDRIEARVEGLAELTFSLV